MRVLVTGGHGFVGSHLVTRLVRRGDAVRCLYRHPGRPAALEGLPVEVVHGDVRDPASLRDAVEGVDTVFHLAALTRSRTRGEMFETNAQGTSRLVEAARRAGLRGRFVLCSSLAAAGPSPGGRPLVEDDPCRPVTWYGESKRQAEVATLRAAADLAVTVVRPPAVYGPRDADFLALFRAAEQGLAPVLGLPERQYSFVYAEDLAEGMIAASVSPAAVGRTFYVSCDAEVVTTRSLVDAIVSATGRGGVRVRVPDATLRIAAAVGELVGQVTGRAPLINRQRLLETGAPSYLCSAAALARDVGYRAQTTLALGSTRTRTWYLEQGWIRARHGSLTGASSTPRIHAQGQTGGR